MGIWALYNPKLLIWPLIGLPDLAGDRMCAYFDFDRDLASRIGTGIGIDITTHLKPRTQNLNLKHRHEPGKS